MIPQDQEVTIKKFILTNKGQKQIAQLEKALVLSHEHLRPSQEKMGTKPITLQTLSFHRNNPISLENTSITPTLLDHEIHSKISKDKKIKDVVLIDSSTYGNNEKNAEVFRKYNIVRGYNYQLPTKLQDKKYQSLTKQIEVLISKENISKDIEYIFGVGGDDQKGFLGQIDIPFHLSQSQKGSKHYKSALNNLILSYAEFSSKTGCPIYLNLLPRGENGFKSQQNNQNNLNTYVNFLLNILSQNKSAASNLVMINPQIVIKTCILQKQIRYLNQSQGVIQDLYKKGFNILFDLSRYQNQMSLIWLSQYLVQYPNQTILSPGLKFKTDFTQFGGEGLTMETTMQKIRSNLGQRYQQIEEKVLRGNCLKLFAWYQKKIIKVQVKMWACAKCGKQSPQTEQSFRKFNKDFCSIDCIRSYKF